MILHSLLSFMTAFPAIIYDTNTIMASARWILRSLPVCVCRLYHHLLLSLPACEGDCPGAVLGHGLNVDYCANGTTDAHVDLIQGHDRDICH